MSRTAGQRVAVLKAWVGMHSTAREHLPELQLDGVWYKKEKSKGQTTCEALVELSEELQIDVLVVGSFGRKGERM